MLKKILAVLAGIGAALSAVFFVLFRQAKEEQKTEHKENENLKKDLQAVTDADKAANEVKKENEELVKKAHGNNNINAFNACNELLSK